MMNQSLPQAYIQFVNGPLAEQVFPLGDGEIWIGSHPRNHIVIPDQTIQPWHARLAWDKGRLIVQGYQESPIAVNLKSVSGLSYIMNGDEISLGQASIVFRVTLNTTARQNDLEAASHQSGAHATPGQSGAYTAFQQSGA
ncbi:MAG: FHA domain-containing protein, partial [Chloroflexi bacterium]|nr:FHA domain-containing protein [Chloroflexota bacterium]